MGKRTGVITYNLNDRGRSYGGQDRDIDIGAAMAVLNGPAIQELVRKGDIYGYFGHGFRVKYGLKVPETAIEGGKVVVLEPCVRTVFIKCMPDGTLQHNQEFLDNSPGRIAARLFDSKAYGFSSVFHAPEENGKRTPKTFHGMDFVQTPNYDTNRGYDAMLDSADASGLELESEGFAAEYAAMMDSVEQVISGHEKVAAEMSANYLHQCQMNDDLVDLNARLMKKLDTYKAAGHPGAMLDSVDPTQLQRGSMFTPDRAAMMLDSAVRFDRAVLPDDTAAAEEKPETKKTAGILSKGMDVVRSVIRTV
jgi:hypothetical protein